MKPDLLRVARAACLKSEAIGGGQFIVTGGSAPHRATLEPEPSCDCWDFSYRPGSACKHLLLLRLEAQDPEAWAMLAEFIGAVLPSARPGCQQGRCVGAA